MSEVGENGHGGVRDGAGRPKGSLNRRSLEVIQEVADRFPSWSPLLHLATVANDENLDIEIRLDAAKAAAPYVHAKLRPVVADADQLVDLEARIARARLEAQAAVLDHNPGIADRLARALMRTREDDLAFVAASRPVVVDMTAAPEPRSEPVPTATSLRGEANPPINAASDWEEPRARSEYQPVLSPYPERQAFLDEYEKAPGTLLSCYRDT